MNAGPELNIELDAATFRGFYDLKRELADFRKENGLPTPGSKAELTGMVELKKALPGHHRYERSDLCALD